MGAETIESSGESLPAARPAARKGGLKRQWRRAFAVIVSVMALGVAIDVVAMCALVSRLRDTAEQIEHVQTVNARLQGDLTVFGDHAHLAIEETPVDESDAGAVREAVESGFEELIGTDVADASALTQDAYQRWVALTADSAPIPGEAADERFDRHVHLEGELDALDATLDEASAAERAAARAALSRAHVLEYVALTAILVMGAVVVALMAVYARRMAREVLGPIDALRVSAGRLAAGHIDHRVELDSDNEYSDLVAAFNAMADAIAGNQRTLNHQARHDGLTGLANRTDFGEQLDASLSAAESHDRVVAILFVDLDDFKDVNDTLGHAAGDALLQVVAERISTAVRAHDVVARLGGDEFAVLLDDVGSEEMAETIAQRVVAVLAAPVGIGDTTVQVGASVGLAMHTHGVGGDQLMRNADVAMYTAKRAGKNRVERFDATHHDAVVQHQTLRIQVMHAVEAGQLELDYQPIIDLASGRLHAVEALVRWQHPTEGRLPPSALLPLAEETGAIVEIGQWVLDTAARQVAHWQQHHRRPDLDLAVNVSARQLARAEFADDIIATVRRNRLDPRRLVVEIPEVAFSNPSIGERLAQLHRHGVRVALDNFGTGQSVLSQIHRLEVDILKVDRSFVVADQPTDSTGMLDTLVALGLRLGLDVIPEGIEDNDQLTHLRQLGCRTGQGFLLARPGAPTSIEELLGRPPGTPWHGDPAAGDRLDDEPLTREPDPSTTSR